MINICVKNLQQGPFDLGGLRLYMAGGCTLGRVKSERSFTVQCHKLHDAKPEFDLGVVYMY